MENSNSCQDIFTRQADHKYKAKNSSYGYRLKKLKKLKKLIIGNKDKIAQAVEQDFHKPHTESYLTEILPVISILNTTIKNLRKWMSDEPYSTPLLFKGTSSWVRREAKGVCLIISPWNYPFHLCVYPLITAFSAGNTSILKPSEFTPVTNQIIREIIKEVFTEEEAMMIEGDADTSTELLKMPFDHIFFTGSTPVGKIVMEAAAKNLASVSLELGGKSPVIIDGTYDLRVTADKILWAKLVNSGQTCIAPDYAIVYKQHEAKFLSHAKKSIEMLYPKSSWETNPDYNHIITKRHAKRLHDLIEDAIQNGAELVYGGEYFENTGVIGPTILRNVDKKMRIMQEEIFGPILPIVTIDSKESTVEFIQSFDNALAMYIFSSDEKNIQYFMDHTMNGGVTINDSLISVAHPLLPFGGAGKSGIGKYHGKHGFDEFSNLRSVMKRKMDLGASYFYPPYTQKKKLLVSFLLNKLSGIF